MSIFSFLKKKKTEEKPLAIDQPNESVQHQEEPVNAEPAELSKAYAGGYHEIASPRRVMTSGVPADYYFSGDKNTKGANYKLLAPIAVDCVKALKEGVAVEHSWDPSKCFLVAENDKYAFYNYGCYPDGSGGTTIRQSKTNPKDTVFFGRARMMNCIFHGHLLQVNTSAYADELYLWTKDIETGRERIFPWFGKYAIPTGRGSRYDQDHIKGMHIDSEADAVVIDVERSCCTFVQAQDEEDRLCNIDCKYTLTITYDGEKFHGVAAFDSIKTALVFDE